MSPRALVLMSLFCMAPAWAAIDIASPAAAYSQSFDSLAQTGSSVPWVNDTTLAGWSLFHSDGSAATAYSTANTNAGGFRSAGTVGSSDRALGAVGSAGFEGHVAAAFRNTSSRTFTEVTIGFDGEQWRNSGAAAQTMTFQYGFGSSFGSVGSWLAPGAGYDWTSPVVGSPAGAVIGNTVGQVSGLGGSLALVWNPTDTLWLRWAERNDLGSDHSLAIDNFHLSVSPVPEPGSAVLMLAGLAMTGAVARRRRLHRTSPPLSSAATLSAAC